VYKCTKFVIQLIFNFLYYRVSCVPSVAYSFIFILNSFPHFSHLMIWLLWNVCYYVSADSRYWRIDHKKIHTKEKSEHSCNICWKMSRFKSNLYRHRKIHAEDSYTCGICGTIFDTKKYLKGHLVTHDESLQYKCKHCQKAFKTKKYLRQHMKRVHYW
jgi:uncharacterized C2H2 Zn-finger protein